MAQLDWRGPQEAQAPHTQRLLSRCHEGRPIHHSSCYSLCNLRAARLYLEPSEPVELPAPLKNWAAESAFSLRRHSAGVVHISRRLRKIKYDIYSMAVMGLAVPECVDFGFELRVGEQACLAVLVVSELPHGEFNCLVSVFDLCVRPGSTLL